MARMKTKCRSCGKKWTEHKGIEPTCKLLQVATKALQEIHVHSGDYIAVKTVEAALSDLGYWKNFKQ